MKKIPTLFMRDYNTGLVIPELNPKAEWAIQAPWAAHRKYDGVCVGLFPTLDGKVQLSGGIGGSDLTSKTSLGQQWMARRSVPGRMAFPDDFEPEEFDAATGKHVGWIPIERSSYYDYFLEAEDGLDVKYFGTYELCGPRINKNPENYKTHTLIRHYDTEQIANVQVLDIHEMTVEDAYTALKDTFEYLPIEGVVWRSMEFGMAKLKRKDFGFYERL